MLMCLTFVKNNDIYPITDRLISSSEKIQLLGHKGMVFWFYGLSGSGKSTLAVEMEKKLHTDGKISVLLDGDNLRTGLNKDLGFSDTDREENIRRVSEVASILCSNGLIVLVSLITPLKKFRANARSIIGANHFKEIFVKASFTTCKKRDVKGLYAKAIEGKVKSFTGKTSDFEEPDQADLIINSEKESKIESVEKVYQFLHQAITL